MVVKTTHIQTPDGSAKVEWWGKEKFRGRTTRITSAREHTIITIPDDVILCDFCNVRIEEFPVSVLWGTHALCKKCFENTKMEGGENNG